MCLASAHGLRERKYRRTGTRPSKVAKRSVHHSKYRVGEEDLIKKHGARDPIIQEGIEVQHRCTQIEAKTEGRGSQKERMLMGSLLTLGL